MNVEPYVSAIIVNYKSADHAIECIHSLLRQHGVKLQIIVIDNASKDGSVEKLLSLFPTEIQLIQSEDNLGFGKANNLAAKIAEGDYLLIINPDLKLLASDDLANLVMELHKTANAGVIGPQVTEPRRQRLVKPKSQYIQQRYLKSSPAIHGLPGRIAWILGACMLFPAHTYRSIGGFDENFFLYGEDADICLRLRKAGHTVEWTDKVKVEHWGGASEMSAATYDKWRRKKKGYYQFCIKHYAESDAKRIMRKASFHCRIKLLGLTWRKCLFGTASFSSHSKSEIDRLQAEYDVIHELCRTYPEFSKRYWNP